MLRVRSVLGTIAALCLGTMLPFIGSAGAGGPRVLILDTTVSGGASSTEAVAAANLGFAVDIVDGAMWGEMVTADFADYEGIILGDPTCDGMNAFQPAIDNAAVWSAAVDGNIILIGTDPVFHLSGGANGSGGQTLTEQGVGFALDGSGDTGLYLTLSCAGGDDAANDLLSGFGSFDTVGTDCGDDTHIVASHPALSGLTDEDLANWGCSTHDGFTVWPTDAFQVLALSVTDVDPVYTADDGTQGNPYILASGEGLEPIRAVTLSPATQSATVGATCTVDVTVQLAGTPVAAGEVTMEVTDGPHAGTTGTVTTDGSGNASFAYTGTGVGTDTLVASFDNDGTVLTSNEVTCTFVAGATTSPPADSPPAGGAQPVAVTPTFTG